jgi:DNA repair exonuclease SbcCD ATPase subunit
MSLISEFNDDLSKSNIIEFKKRMCSDLRNACSSIQYWNDYSQTSLGYLGFEPEKKKAYLDKYWELVYEIRETEPNYATEKWSYPDPFGPGLHMSEECYRYWKKKEEDRRVQKEKELKKRIFDLYWTEHAEEKSAFEAERKSLEDQISAMKTEISNIAADTEKANVQEHINALTAEKNSLGLFKGKEKKAIQDKIDAANLELKKIVDRVETAKKEIEKRIEPLQKRIKEIDTELTKDR